MRTTIRVEDELFDRLKAEAAKENMSLTRLINRTLKTGLDAGSNARRKPRPYRERTYAMGTPLVGLDKAAGLAAALEDEETARKLMLRK